MTTQLKDLMSLADNYAQECVYLECENQERRGIVDGSSVAAAYESRQWLENELRRLHAENEALLTECRTLLRQNGEWQERVAELLEALTLIANAENTALDLARCKGIARAAIDAVRGQA